MPANPRWKQRVGADESKYIEVLARYSASCGRPRCGGEWRRACVCEVFEPFCGYGGGTELYMAVGQ